MSLVTYHHIGGSGLESAGFICGFIKIRYTIVEDPSETVGNEQQCATMNGLNFVVLAAHLEPVL